MLRWSLVMLMVLIGAAPATSSTGSATTRATIDLGTPKTAARSLVSAVEREDVAGVKSILDGDESVPELSDVLAELLVASGRMASASTNRFGRSGDPIGRPMLTVNDPAKIDEAQVVEDKDQATLQIVGHRRPMTFRRRDGKWRLKTDAVALVQEPAQLQIKLLKNMALAMNELAREINSGKYQSSAEAERYVQEKLHAVMIETFKPSKGPATTRAATQP
jgi:hypothetical protein